MIETSAGMWRRFISSSIRTIDAYALRAPANDAELAEVVLAMQPGNYRVHVSWMQEDGSRDDLAFYWLSASTSSHFRSDVLAHVSGIAELQRLENSTVAAVRLYGDPNIDAVLACAIDLDQGKTLGFATTRWLPHKQRYSRCGTEHLAVLSGSSFTDLIEDQRLELLAELR